MRIGIVGAGAWGTALAHVAALNGHQVLMWSYDPAVVDQINREHINTSYLPQGTLQHSIRATATIDDLAGSAILINATPTQFIRSTFTQHPNVDQLFAGAIVVNVAKGIEVGTHLRVSEIFDHVLPSKGAFVVLSGPSHAEEVIRDMPTTVVVASQHESAAKAVQEALSTDTFRVYTSADVIGVEICGSLKNVIAIAAGIIDGAKLGDNTKAAVMTRGLAEIARLGQAVGADKDTFFGLAGMGDLIVTCDSRHSRNRFVGEEVGKGRPLDEVLAGMTAVAEGVPTTTAALELAAEAGVELPITQKVAQILFEGEDPLQAIHELMVRPHKSES